MNGYRARTAAAILMTGLLVTACHRPGFLGGKPAAPTGEVVATVDGHEITLRELQAELQDVQVSDPKQQKAAQQRALELIVARTLMADAARKQGIDKTPDFALQRDRLEDGLLAQMLAAQTAKGVPAPAAEEVQRFISDHADLFAQRKIYDVDQIRFVRPSDPEIEKGLAPLENMDAIAAYLVSKNVQAARGESHLDVTQLDPEVVDQIGKLPENEPFVLPVGNLIVVDQIKSSQVVPVQGAEATKYATALLTRQQTQAAVQREEQSVISAGMKRVAYNPEYAPPPPKASPASNAAANAASNAAAQ